MKAEDVIATLEEYRTEFKRILSRFQETRDGIYIRREDDPVWRQKVLEIRDFLTDVLGPNSYSRQIVEYYGQGISNYIGSPSFKSVEDTIGVVGAAITRIKRNPTILEQPAPMASIPSTKNVFIIHGRNEAKWRELKDILGDVFGLNPIILSEQPDAGCSTVIEKFEYYAKNSSYAIAIFTPDDEVRSSDGDTYVQARPNVIYELGWFCGRLGRQRVILLLKEGTSVFSDFGGIIQKRFSVDVVEKLDDIRKDLVAAGVIP